MFFDFSDVGPKLPKWVKKKLGIVNWVSGSTHSYSKIGSEPFWRFLFCTQILCSSLLCFWQGHLFSQKSAPFQKRNCIGNKPFLHHMLNKGPFICFEVHTIICFKEPLSHKGLQLPWLVDTKLPAAGQQAPAAWSRQNLYSYVHSMWTYIYIYIYM